MIEQTIPQQDYMLRTVQLMQNESDCEFFTHAGSEACP